MLKKIALALLALPMFAHAASTPNVPPKATWTVRCVGNAANDTAEVQGAFAAAVAQTINAIETAANTTCVLNPFTITGNITGLTVYGDQRATSVWQAAPGSNASAIVQFGGNGFTYSTITFRSMRFDGNHANQSSGSNGTIYGCGGSTCTHITFEDDDFINAGSKTVDFESTVTQTDLTFVNDLFLNSTCQQLYFTNSVGVLIQGNTFSNYNTSASTCPAIGGYQASGFSMSNFVIVDNKGLPSSSANEFFMEFVPASSLPQSAFAIIGNTCKAAGAAGCGISGSFNYSSIIGNDFSNGLYGDRQGMEVAGYGLALVGNSVECGQVSISGNTTAYGSGGPSGMVVADNTVTEDCSSPPTGASAIEVDTVNDVLLESNHVIFNIPSASPSLGYGFTVGYYGSAGVVNRIQYIHNSVVDLDSSSDNLQAYAILSTSSTHVSLKGNICSGTGLQSCLRFNGSGSSTVDTYLTIDGNDFSQATCTGNSSTCVSTCCTSATGTGVQIGQNYLPGGSQTTQPCWPLLTSSSLSGFGTSPTLADGQCPRSFHVNVGTGGTATSGTVTLPPVLHAYVCMANDGKTVVTVGSYSSTSATATLTVGTAWAASTVVGVSCWAN